MILLLGGTRDAREIAKLLKLKDIGFIYSVQSDYGAELVDGNDFLVQSGKLDRLELEQFIRNNGIKKVIDATHPYAKNISQNAMSACESAHTEYIRFEREDSLKNEKGVLFFNDQKNAAEYLKRSKGKIFLTTGSRELESWDEIDRERLIIRVLPTSDILQKCEALEFKPYQIIAQQGPFSYEENKLIIKRYSIDYIVTKDGGNIAKTLDKISAAKDNGVTAIIIRKPKLSYPRSTSDIKTLLDWITNG